jgi:hypothetical protein
MSWLDRLLRRSSPLNPEEYERVRCDLCDGTGRSIAFKLGQGFSGDGLRCVCGRCHGKGWLMARRDDGEGRE